MNTGNIFKAVLTEIKFATSRRHRINANDAQLENEWPTVRSDNGQ